MRELKNARSVLDLGCGLCELTERIPASVRYLGVEREPWMLERARKLLPFRRFTGADIEDPGFDPGEPVDRIVILAVFEHLERPEKILQRARQWAVRGGRMILTTPAPRAKKILDLGARWGLLSRHAEDEHERLWSIEEIRAAAEDAGWLFVRSRKFLFGLNQLVVLERSLDETAAISARKSRSPSTE